MYRNSNMAVAPCVATTLRCVDPSKLRVSTGGGLQDAASLRACDAPGTFIANGAHILFGHHNFRLQIQRSPGEGRTLSRVLAGSYQVR
jgi:hypothetical protein